MKRESLRRLFFILSIYMDKSLQQQSKKELAEMNVIGKTGLRDIYLVSNKEAFRINEYLMIGWNSDQTEMKAAGFNASTGECIKPSLQVSFLIKLTGALIEDAIERLS
jgi:hypothetical protein